MNRFEVENSIAAMKLAKLKKLKFQADMEYYRRNPDKWLEERFGEPAKTILWDQWPGYEEHKWDGDRNPLYKAWKGLADGNWVGVRSATSTGKTYTMARIVFWFLDCFENPLVVTCAPKEKQLEELLWSEITRTWDKFKKIRPNAVLNSLRIRKDITHNNFYFSAEAIGFVAGVGANEQSATKAQGFHRENMLILIEETPGVSPAIITAFENTSTGSNNFILAVGNPDNINDPLSQFCEQPMVIDVTISGYDHPNVVLNKEVVPGAVTVKSIDRRRMTYGEDSPFFQSRVRGIAPKSSVDSLVNFQWLLDAMGDHKYEPEYDDNGYNGLGIDVANSDDGDKACLAWGKGRTLLDLHEFQCPNANHIAYNVLLSDEELAARPEINNYGTWKIQNFDLFDWCIGIDGVGVGAATVNTFLDEGKQVISLVGGPLKDAIPLDDEDKPMWNFNSLRSQMMWEAREDLRLGNIRIRLTGKKKRDQFIKEAVAHKWSVKAGKIVISGKDDVKKQMNGKSPNMFDAFCYWNWIRKGYYAGNIYTPLMA